MEKIIPEATESQLKNKAIVKHSQHGLMKGKSPLEIWSNSMIRSSHGGWWKDSGSVWILILCATASFWKKTCQQVDAMKFNKGKC